MWGVGNAASRHADVTSCGATVVCAIPALVICAPAILQYADVRKFVTRVASRFDRLDHREVARAHSRRRARHHLSLEDFLPGLYDS